MTFSTISDCTLATFGCVAAPPIEMCVTSIIPLNEKRDGRGDAPERLRRRETTFAQDFFIASANAEESPKGK